MCDGKPIPYTKVKPLGGDGAEAGPDVVGHARGYYENPEANSAAVTADRWARTGTLALWHDGDLYVTGRSNEYIFVNGQKPLPARPGDGPEGRVGGRKGGRRWLRIPVPIFGPGSCQGQEPVALRDT
jgi:hypothetical protein